MNKLAIMNKMPSVVTKSMFQLKKHSPEILIIGGAIGTVTSAVMACRATTKLSTILDESKDTIDKIHEVSSDETMMDRYTPEDAKKDLMITYVQTGVKVAKLYAPSVALGVFSIGCMLASNNILRKRNIALAAAYATVDKSFKEYRDRVIERFGETVDRELKYNIKAKKVEKTVTDPETGKEKKVKENTFVVNPSDVSGYARFFESYTKDADGNVITNPYWQNDNEMNLMFIKCQERYANDLLRVKKRVFLNEVYKMLGLPETKAGQVVGWVLDESENPTGDNYISFGLYSDNLSYSDYVNGFDPAILLDFNVDGNIWELMK